jgi:hypothetical protein
MQALAQWWRRLTTRSARQAWGLAPHGMAWDLVGLTRQSHGFAKVHTTVSLQAPAGWAFADLAWLSQALRHNGRLRGGGRHRLNMALPAAHLQEGVIDFPAQLPKEDWLYEVQLEVSQALQLSPDEVNFDFEPAPLTDGLVQRVHWMGCAQAHMVKFKDCTRAAGWRLAAVESEAQAAQRGVRALLGGVSSLLTQAPQDWQFRLATPAGLMDEGGSSDSDEAMDEAIRQVLSTPAGARLVASGLALKAWQ